MKLRIIERNKQQDSTKNIRFPYDVFDKNERKTSKFQEKIKENCQG